MVGRGATDEQDCVPAPISNIARGTFADNPLNFRLAAPSSTLTRGLCSMKGASQGKTSLRPAARSISLTASPRPTRPGSESSPRRHPAPVQALAVALDVLTSVLSETEGHQRLRLRLSLVIRGGITLQQRPTGGARVAYTTRRYSAPNLQRADATHGSLSAPRPVNRAGLRCLLHHLAGLEARAALPHR